MIAATVRITEERMQEIRVEYTRRGIKSFQQCAEEAIDRWMNAEPTPAAQPIKVVGHTLSKDEARLVDQFIDLIREGDAAAVEMVKSGLAAHSRARRQARQKLSS